MKHSENISKTTHIQHQKAESPFFSEQEKGAGETGKSAFWGGTGINSFFPRAGVQAKLTIGQPGDQYEQEADAMADQVVQKMAAGRNQPVQRMCADCAKEQEQGITPKLQAKSIFESNEEPVQRKCAKCEAESAREEQGEQPAIQTRISPMLQTSRSEEGAASSDLESRLSSTKGGGSPLPDQTRSSMESSFGADFSGVRVHTNAGSVKMNQELGAQAFTHGSDIYFNSGKYSPGSTEGQRLLGHELTHVVQQGGGHAGHMQQKEKSIQREAEDAAKKKGNFKVFSPKINASVGKSGKNNPEDVKVVQELLISQGYDLVKINGTIDEATQAAIIDFQMKKFRNWKKPDGRIDVNQMTWKALTKNYFFPDETDRERKQFDIKKSVMFFPDDISKAVQGTLAYVSDSDKDLKDDVIEWNRQSAEKSAGVNPVPVKNIHHVTRVLQQYYDKGISIDTLIFSSHGSYQRHGFLVGNEVITIDRISRLKPLRNLLAPSTKLVVMACHVGGGSNPQKAKIYAKKLADTLGITVYTSRSWSIGTKNLFNVGVDEGDSKTYASYFGKPSAYEKSDIKNRPNVYEFLGEWLEATPGKKETKVKVVNAVEFKPDGTFTVSDKRFPGLSEDEQKLLQDLINESKKPKTKTK